MIQTVVKRDGRIVGFNEQKIMAAIRKAMLHTDKGEDERLLYQITDHIAQGGESQMTVEQIQDLVEVELMKSSRKDVAQKYIAYRHQRSVARKAKTREVFLDIVNIKSTDVTRENANMNADTPAGMMMKFASETTKPFVDDYLLSEETRDAVEKNYMHIHDKDYYPTTSTIRTTIRRSRSLVCSTRWTIFSSVVSLLVMVPPVLPVVLRRHRCWPVSRWSAVRMKCTVVRLSLPSTSISPLMCG